MTSDRRSALSVSAPAARSPAPSARATTASATSTSSSVKPRAPPHRHCAGCVRQATANGPRPSVASSSRRSSRRSTMRCARQDRVGPEHQRGAADDLRAHARVEPARGHLALRRQADEAELRRLRVRRLGVGDGHEAHRNAQHAGIGARRSPAAPSAARLRPRAAPRRRRAAPGSRRPADSATMAITTSSSSSVKPRRGARRAAVTGGRSYCQEPMSASLPSPPGWPSAPKLKTSISPLTPGFRYW